MDLVLRIVFSSGKVAEERGSEADVIALFQGDPGDLIDHILAFNVATGQPVIYGHENTSMVAAAEIITCRDLGGLG